MYSLLLIGYGNMGSAMLTSWQNNRTHDISDFHVIDPNHSTDGMFFRTLSELPSNIHSDIIVFATKPQQLADILPQYQKRFGIDPLYISIAAGKTLNFFAGYLGNNAKIIRAMPNTPALVGKAITALCANKNTSDTQKETVKKLIETFGKAVWVDECNMDAITAISGSGPAYVFLFLEAVTKSGIKAGLSHDIAKILALEMMHGSIHLAAKSNDNFEKLRQNVTSKGGVTEAALSILMRENILENLIEDTINAAIRQAELLSK